MTNTWNTETHILSDISNTRKRYPNTDKWIEKNEAQSIFFNQLLSVWVSAETLFRVFDIASHSINNSWRNSKQKFTEFYDNEITYPNLLHGRDLPFFLFMNY